MKTRATGWLGTGFCLLLFPHPCLGHLSGPKGVDYYTRVTPGPDGVHIMLDVYFGEVVTAAVCLRHDKNKDGELDAGELDDYVTRATPGYLRKMLVRIGSVNPADMLTLPVTRVLPTEGSEETAYLAKGNADQRTLRMRWTVLARWPEAIASRPESAFVLHVNILGALRGTSCITALGQVSPPLQVIESDIPSDHDAPLPVDDAPAIQDTSRVPRVSSARLVLRLDATASAAEPPQESRDPQSGSPAGVQTNVGGAMATSQDSGLPPGRVAESETRIRAQVLGLVKHASSPGARVLAVLLCLIWGGLHAFTPGHGKAIVSTYLLGAGARYRHALILGLLVTVTHTAVVLIVALVALILKDRFVFPTWLQPAGIVIVMLVGANQVRLGLVRLLRMDHAQSPRCAPRASWLPAFLRRAFGHTHAHHPAVPDVMHGGSPISRADMASIGLSGGMVPCPAAVVLLLLSWQVNAPLLGLLCLVSFSVGLAVALSSVGMLAIAGTQAIVRWAAGREGTDAATRLDRLGAWMPLVGGLMLLTLGVLLLRVYAAAP